MTFTWACKLHSHRHNIFSSKIHSTHSHCLPRMIHKSQPKKLNLVVNYDFSHSLSFCHLLQNNLISSDNFFLLSLLYNIFIMKYPQFVIKKFLIFFEALKLTNKTYGAFPAIYVATETVAAWPANSLPLTSPTRTRTASDIIFLIKIILNYYYFRVSKN